MPSLFKGTIIFGGRNHGWTESWWNLWPSNSYDAVFESLRKVAIARNELLSNDVEIIGARVSMEGLKNDGYSEYLKIVTNSASPNCSGDEPDACVVAHAVDANRGRKKTIYLRGIPDSIDINFGKLVTDPCEWGKSFDRWAGTLTKDGWGWIGRPSGGPTRMNVAGYTQGDDGRVTITFTGNLFPGPVLGTKQVVTINGINKPGKSVLSGQILVLVDSATQCTTYDPIAVFPYISGGHGLFAVPEFIPAAKLVFTRIGTRRVGTPLLVSRGRGRARAKG